MKRTKPKIFENWEIKLGWSERLAEYLALVCLTMLTEGEFVWELIEDKIRSNRKTAFGELALSKGN